LHVYLQTKTDNISFSGWEEMGIKERRYRRNTVKQVRSSNSAKNLKVERAGGTSALQNKTLKG
jgi:hypothetical protein